MIWFFLLNQDHTEPSVQSEFQKNDSDESVIFSESKHTVLPV